MAVTYNNLYLDIRQQLRRSGVEAATLEARELVCFGVGKSREELQRDGGLYASPELERQVRQLVDRRLAGSRWRTSSASGSFTACPWTSPGTC